MNISLHLSDQPNHDQAAIFWKMLSEYNAGHVGPSDREQLYILLRDDDGKIHGGLNGSTCRGWLFVENLVVHEELRGQGYGSRLLTAAEEEARKRGCHAAYLDTYSFQARPFYEKRGYAVFGTLEDCPAGHQRFFLSKKL